MMARNSKVEELSVVADPSNLYHMKLSDFRITLQNHNYSVGELYRTQNGDGQVFSDLVLL